MDDRVLFLDWFINRLLYKHNYSSDSAVVYYLKEIKKDLAEQHTKKIDIDQKNLDKIIQKYYVDFFFDKDKDLGFTEEERNRLRQVCLDLSTDIINYKHLNKGQGT